TLLTPDHYRVMPWKNGQGSTTEIAVHPPGAGLDEFTWRLSIAEIGQDGPFSAFPGVDRTILLLVGAGMVLEFDEAPAHVLLERRFVHFSFRGEWHTQCRLLDGPVRDVNVMTVRARARHRVEVLHLAERPERRALAGDVTLLHALEGGLRVHGPSGDWSLGPGDTLRLDDGATELTIGAAHAAAIAYLIEIALTTPE
ncbi:MAG TPA: HutD family protein, partial [Candidatus Competibacteraceae bacterium]|nr:HutD family protein [Candidatus Competibacteraceae bacterium]